MFSKPQPDDNEFGRASLPPREKAVVEECGIFADVLSAVYESGSAREFLEVMLDLMEDPLYGKYVPYVAGIQLMCEITEHGASAPSKEDVADAKGYDSSEKSVREVLDRLSPSGNLATDWNMVKAAGISWYYQAARNRSGFMEHWKAATK